MTPVLSSSPSTTLPEASEKLQNTELALRNWRQYRANLGNARRLSGKALADIRDTNMRIVELERTKAQYEAILRNTHPVQVEDESPAPALRGAMVNLPASTPVSASDAPDQIPGAISEAVVHIASSSDVSSSPVASSSSVQLPDLPAPLQTQMANDPIYGALDRLSGDLLALGGGSMGGVPDSDVDTVGRGIDNFRGAVSTTEE